MFPEISGAAVDLGLPEEISSLSIQVEYGLRMFRWIGGGEKDAVAYVWGLSVPATRHGRFPQNPFGLTPSNWWALSGRRNAVVRRSTPRGPVGGGDGNGQRGAGPVRDGETSAGAGDERENRSVLHKVQCRQRAQIQNT